MTVDNEILELDDSVSVEDADATFVDFNKKTCEARYLVLVKGRWYASKYVKVEEWC